MEDISKLKESVHDFLSYTTSYIQDLQDKNAEIIEQNSKLQAENNFLRIALKYINKKKINNR
jgi:regulator of replication initiation timing